MSKIKNIEVTFIEDDGTERKVLMTLEQFRCLLELKERMEEASRNEFPTNLIPMSQVAVATKNLIEAVKNQKHHN